jgi:hypothetical protein
MLSKNLRRFLMPVLLVWKRLDGVIQADRGPGYLAGRSGLEQPLLPTECLHEDQDGDPQTPLQITAMGMLCADSLQFEELAQVCAEEGRWEFLVVLSPLRLPRATGSPFNPIAVF